MKRWFLKMNKMLPRYLFIIRIGRKKRGVESYEELMAKTKNRTGKVFTFKMPGLLVYHTMLHVVGSLILVLIFKSLENIGFGFTGSFLGWTFVLFMIYKEFGFDRKYCKQEAWKGWIDFLAWLVPMAIFIL